MRWRGCKGADPVLFKIESEPDCLYISVLSQTQPDFSNYEALYQPDRYPVNAEPAPAGSGDCGSQ